MKLTFIALNIACCLFTPTLSSYYLIKVADDKANGANEEILHYQPEEKNHGAEEKTKKTSHANKLDHDEKDAAETDDKEQAAGRVSHSSFSQGSLEKHHKNADDDAKLDYHAYSGEAGDPEKEEVEKKHVETDQYKGRTDDNVVVSLKGGNHLLKGGNDSLKRGNDYNERTCKVELKIKPCSGN